MTTSADQPVIGSLCTGYGGLDLGVAAALGGARLAWCADPDPHIATVLSARFPGVPNLGDIRAVDWTTVEPVDIVTAGFPCQDISAAGRRAGIEKGERSGVWQHIVAALRVLRPRPILVLENVAALRWRNGGLHRVLADLAEAGYDAIWRSVCASDIGAPHRRERVFVLGWPRRRPRYRDAADTDSPRRKLQRTTRRQPARRTDTTRANPAPVDANGCRLPIVRHPDRQETWSSNTTWMRDAHRLRPAPAHTDGVGRQELHSSDTAGRSVSARRGQSRQSEVAANAPRDRRDEGLPQAARLQGRPHAALGHHAASETVGVEQPAIVDHPCIDWGTYTEAIRHWERLLGRPTPIPTQPGRHGRPVLAPAFVEHLMALPPGWISDLTLPRTAQLRALGNGVVPPQAAHAISLLLADLDELTGSRGSELEARAA